MFPPSPSPLIRCLTKRPLPPLFSSFPHLCILHSTRTTRALTRPLAMATPFSTIPTPPPMPPDVDRAHWHCIPATQSTPKHYLYLNPIEKSEQDDREYRLIRLENGLEAVLIHDRHADKSAASLDVAVGHLSDPDDMPGLAHFCEHLLFMGTEQFPKENDYSEYLAKNSGSSNAYTAASNTNYYFNVSVDALEGALERFSGFFHSPLFSPSCTLRELNAVDSENKKNLQVDIWRIFQLSKFLTKPGHPWSKFGTGNKLSLTDAARKVKLESQQNGLKAQPATGLNGTLLPSPVPSRVPSPTPSVASGTSENEADGGIVGRETRRRLIEWWSKEYCASRMSLAIIGNESLDELTSYVTKYFSPIVNRGQEACPMIRDHPFGENESGKMVFINTVMDIRAIELSFPIPYMVDDWRVKPDFFIAHFVGHEGSGSLYGYLKSKGWITALSSGAQDVARGFSMFKLTVHLTKDGFKNYKEVALACFKYLDLLRTSPLPTWMHEERKELAATRFRFLEKGCPDSYAQRIASHMRWPTPRESIISAPALVQDWDEQVVRTYLSTLIPEKGRVFVMGKNMEEIGISGPWQTEKWYGTQYLVTDLFATQESCRNDIPELFLPPPNEFIPKNFSCPKISVSEPLHRPLLIKSTDLSEVWHKKDDQFKVPKARIFVEMRTPEAKSGVRESVMMRIYAELVKDAVNEYAYDAELAGFKYEIYAHHLGLAFCVSGYNDKLDVLLQRLLEKARHLVIKADRLEVIKENMKQSWENFFLDQSYGLSEYYGKYLLLDGMSVLSERIATIPGITVDDLKEHVDKLLSQVKYKILINGNVFKDDATRIANVVESTLSTSPLPKGVDVSELSRILPEGCNYVWELPVPNPNQVNSAITYFCHVGDQANPRLRTTFRLLNQIMKEPAFNVLRTQEQLGYIVSCREWQGAEYIGLRILVQSERDPRYLETRIEAYLIHMRSVLESMDEATFEEHKKALIKDWTQKLKNLDEESRRFWDHIETGDLDFQRRKKDSVTLQTVTKAEVISLFNNYIDPASPRRSKLSVHLKSTKPRDKKFSLAAAHGFLPLLRSHNVPVNEEQYLGLSEQEPPLDAVKAHWTNMLLGPDGMECTDGTQLDKVVAQSLLGELDKLADQYPAAGDEKVELSSSVEYINDAEEFKSKLRLSGPVKPVEEFPDLPVPEYNSNVKL